MSVATESYTGSVRVRVFPKLVLRAVDDDGGVPGPREATPARDLLYQVDQILRFLRQLSVPPLQKLEVLHLLAHFHLLIWVRDV